MKVLINLMAVNDLNSAMSNPNGLTEPKIKSLS